MPADPAPPWKRPMFYVQLIAILFLAFGYAVSPTLFSSAPAYNRPWSEVLLATLVIALVVFGLGRLLPPLNKGLTVLLILGALVVPGIIVGLWVVTWGEQASARWEVKSALRKAMQPGHVENLAAFLAEPSGPMHGLAMRPDDVTHLQQYAETLPPQVLKDQRVVEHLLRGLEIRPTDTRSSQLPDESLEALCRLYVVLKARTGFSPDGQPLDLRQRARFATRVAELGLWKWRQELTGEHPAFTQLAPFFTKGTLEELFPKPLAPGERVYSQTVGSLPLFTLMSRDSLAPPTATPQDDPYGFVDSWYRDFRELWELMRSRGIDFTEEELRDERLQAVLKRVRDA